jgi:uncharacterized membrane protein
MLKQIARIAVVLGLAFGLVACSGSATKTVVEREATQGQQLLDLKEAYDKGAITESEYKQTKSKILEQG